MELFPAIDIRGGRVVRLSQGSAARETVYDDDPVRVAERFAEAGARWIHLVDLDRAFDQGSNDVVVRRVADRVGARLRLQLGGGLRTLERVRAALDLGVARLVIGTAAATDPEMVAAAAALAGPERLAVGLDARDGFVAVRGWTETSTLRTIDLARRVVAQGIGTLIYTDVARDGMLEGPDVDGARALQTTGARVVASGGVASLADLRRLGRAGLAGAIIGRALYEGRIALGDALALLRDEFSAA
ncbi:MAG TPA: 1-(5-phosphoribosyl)-5-[(5-phosphoribosylamino)methylideneamino]imidazole-4-carboxamide isomerase [Gemmatimonadales bacterium]|nr:1-(5-phosphoribosyl)-5-[(5-phosphoribosylamino)methylideneamino]imidazole-4-carboxamide isomerase [Gemmatimonadales bacterium]